MDAKDRAELQRFSNRFITITDELVRHSQYLRLSPDKEKLRDRALQILAEKAEALRDAEKKSEFKEVLKVGKILRKNDDDEDDY